jgi:hypothetical protein
MTPFENLIKTLNPLMADTEARQRMIDAVLGLEHKVGVKLGQLEAKLAEYAGLDDSDAQPPPNGNSEPAPMNAGNPERQP